MGSSPNLGWAVSAPLLHPYYQYTYSDYIYPYIFITYIWYITWYVSWLSVYMLWLSVKSLLSVYKSAFTSYCCCKKLPQIYWFKTTQIYSTTALEVKVQSQSHWADSFWRLLGRVHSLPFQLLEAAHILWLILKKWPPALKDQEILSISWKGHDISQQRTCILTWP